MGAYVDALKFAGGSFALIPRQAVRDLIELCHAHDVSVSTGGFIEYVQALGLEAVMFEAASPAVFAWYIKHYGPEVNLFVDHSQIVQLETLRAGIWGTQSLWGRVLTYKG
jgi:phosphosulfolactate synthase (CoM biosynthesis protein A)